MSEFMASKRTCLLIACLILMLMLHLPRGISSVLSNAGWLYLARCFKEAGPQEVFPLPCAHLELAKRALDMFALASDVDSSSGSAAAGLSWVFVSEGDDNQALQWAHKAVTARRDNVIMHLLLGSLAQDVGNQELALQAWESANAAPYFCNQAERTFLLGDVESALILYWRAIQIDPQFDEAYLELGKIYLDTSEFALARQAFESKVALAPDRGGYAWLGRTLEAMGEIDVAIEAYTRAAGLGELWYGYIAAGDLYYQQREYGLAREWYLRAQEAFPGVMSINLKLGNVELRENQCEQARRYFQVALEQAPGHPLPIYHMGMWFYTQGDYETARDWFEEALNKGLQPDYWFYKALADSYRHLGDCDLALRSYQAALQIQSVNAPESERMYIIRQIENLEKSVLVSEQR